MFSRLDGTFVHRALDRDLDRHVRGVTSRGVEPLRDPISNRNTS
ncbi:MAG: hypothetical protein ACXWXI_10615 [Aeromicrobium sp.]